MGKKDKGAARLTIAIDGPAGAGKSTIARLVAQNLCYKYIETGSMYRALTWKALQEGADIENENELLELLGSSQFDFAPYSDTTPNGGIYLDGKDVTPYLRLASVDKMVSKVAEKPKIRQEFVKLQRKLAADSGVVMDGRDIGTVVLPKADLKIYLTASLQERARRRYAQLQDRHPSTSLDEIERDIARRDQLDKERKVGPLKQARDAYYIDTTDITPEQVMQQIVALWRERKRRLL
jgi:cytidylate kinase